MNSKLPSELFIITVFSLPTRFVIKFASFSLFSNSNNKVLNIQKQDYKYSQMKFDEGIISKLDLLQQKESLLYMQKLAANSKIDCYVGLINLYKATGAKI